MNRTSLNVQKDSAQEIYPNTTKQLPEPYLESQVQGQRAKTPDQ